MKRETDIIGGMVRKESAKAKHFSSKVRGLRVHNGEGGFHEFSESEYVNSLFHPSSSLVAEAEETFFWSVRVQLFDLEESAFLYFDDRPTIQDALFLLWNTLRPQRAYEPLWALSESLFSAPLNESHQISLFLSETKSSVLYLVERCRECEDLTLESGNEAEAEEPETEDLDDNEYIDDSIFLSSDSDTPFHHPLEGEMEQSMKEDTGTLKVSLLRFSDSSKPLPSSPLGFITSPRFSGQEEETESFQIRNNETLSNSEPYMENASDSHEVKENNHMDINVENAKQIIDTESGKKEKEHFHLFRHFLVMLTLHTGVETHFSICLDMSQSVSSATQQILQAYQQATVDSTPNDEMNYSYWEYGLFVPHFMEDKRVLESEFSEAEKAAGCNVQEVQGTWLNNDSYLETAISLMDCKSPVLMMKARDTPREILVKLMPPVELIASGAIEAEYHDIEIKVMDLGMATMIFSSQCTVKQAVQSVYRTVCEYRGTREHITDQASQQACLVWEGKSQPFTEGSLLLTYLKEQQGALNKDTTEMKICFYFDVTEVPPENPSNSVETNDTAQILDTTSQLTTSEENLISAQLLRASELIMQQPQLLEGEKIITRFHNIIFSCPPQPKTHGTLFITNFQLVFLSTDRSSYFSKNPDCYLPITSIWKIMDLARDSLVYTAHHVLSKNLMSVIYCIEGQPPKNLHLFHEALRGVKVQNSFFAYNNKEASLLSQQYTLENGWNIYNPVQEYTRIGLTPNNGWRISSTNRYHKICETYPDCFVVPSQSSDELVQKVAAFRSKERLPATVWRHPKSGATITRCAQPRIGLKFLSKGSRSSFDETLIQHIREAHSSERPLRVIDCRPLTNAKANHLRKGGYEDISNYQSCTMKFLNIGNIHVVRESFSKLHSLCQYENIHNNPQWLSKLESTNWPQIVGSVLKGALIVTKSVDKLGQSVVVHCSDGWDRTPQVCSLAQFMMDPYYRTLLGFQVLIEKEWISFGHMFATRVGHIHTDKQNESPIFLLFLECIWQIMQQYPCSIEFNEDLLIFIMDQVYNCRFGTFLKDSQAQCRRDKVAEKTTSIWTIVNHNKGKYLSAAYRAHNHVLYPSSSSYAFNFWRGYYLRYSCSPIIKESINRTIFQKMKSSHEQKLEDSD